MRTANSIRRQFEREMGKSALQFILSGKVDKHGITREWEDYWENGVDGEVLCYWIGHECAKMDNATGLRVDEWIANHFSHYSGVAKMCSAYRRGHTARRTKGNKAA